MKSKPRIIGLNGLPRTGKDSIADVMVERHGFIKLAFADALYQELSEAYQVSVDDLRSDVWKSKPVPALTPVASRDPAFSRVCCNEGFFPDEPLSSRRLLQLWGTSYRRNLCGRDYWVGKMLGRLRTHQGQDLILPDVRHDNEAAMGLRAVARGEYQSFHVVEVLRPGVVNTGHGSDSGLSGFLINAQVRNDTTIDAAVAQLCSITHDKREERTHER